MEAINRIVYSNDWITGLVILSLLFMVLAREIFYNRFMSFLILPFNNKYILLFNKKGRLLSGFHLIFTAFQLLNVSLFIYLALNIWAWKPLPESIISPYVIILSSILLFTLAKLCLQLFGGYVFNIEKVIQVVIFNKGSYLNYSALILFLFNLLIAYRAPHSKLLLVLGICIALVINLSGWVMLLKSYLKQVTTHFVYFILYLCALEIAPFVIVFYVLNV